MFPYLSSHRCNMLWVTTTSFLDLTWLPWPLLCHFPKVHYLLSLRLPAFVPSISLPSPLSCTLNTNSVFFFFLSGFHSCLFPPRSLLHPCSQVCFLCEHLLHAPPGHHFLCECQHLKDFPFEEIPIPQFREQSICKVS